MTHANFQPDISHFWGTFLNRYDILLLTHKSQLSSSRFRFEHLKPITNFPDCKICMADLIQYRLFLLLVGIDDDRTVTPSVYCFDDPLIIFLYLHVLVISLVIQCEYIVPHIDQ